MNVVKLKTFINRVKLKHIRIESDYFFLNSSHVVDDSKVRK